MKAVTLPRYGGPEVISIADLPKPAPGAEQVLVRVRAIGVNRADCLQRQGLYPMPPGVGDIPGLELAGEVEAVGPDVEDLRAGDRVFGLVAEGGYAEYAVIDQGLAVPIPEKLSFVEAAAVIEVFCTANETMFGLGDLKAGETVLIHAGASGVGTAAVQMAKHAGATVYFTAGSRGKVDRVVALGAHLGINYKEDDFVEEILRATAGEGVDVIEDFIGADYLTQNLTLLKTTGRLVLIGLMGGDSGRLDIGLIIRKRLKVLGFTLRAQPLEEKRAIVRRFRDRWLPLLADGTITPIVHATLPFDQVRRAHEMMEANENFGKIILTVE